MVNLFVGYPEVLTRVSGSVYLPDAVISLSMPRMQVGRPTLTVGVLAYAESYRILGIAIVAPPPKFTIEFRHS